MKILCVRDPHFKVNNSNDTDKMVDKILSLIDNTSPDCVVVLGDVLNDHSKVNSYVLSKAIEFLRQIKNRTNLFR